MQGKLCHASYQFLMSIFLVGSSAVYDSSIAYSLSCPSFFIMHPLVSPLMIAFRIRCHRWYKSALIVSLLSVFACFLLLQCMLSSFLSVQCLHFFCSCSASPLSLVTVQCLHQPLILFSALIKFSASLVSSSSTPFCSFNILALRT